MKLQGKRLLVCNCEASMPLDAGKLTKACQAAGAEGELELNTQLCRAQLGNFQAAILGAEPVLTTCTQEAPLFGEVTAEDNPQQSIDFVNIREMAGWSAEAGQATPKIAALLAAASEDADPPPTVSYASEGTCLVYGRGQQALEAAQQLAGRLDVTLLLEDADDLLPPRRMEVPIFAGRISGAKGHLGAFGVTVDGYAAADPASKLELTFDAPRNGAFSECDLILDLSGGTPLFPAHDRRDGYLRPDPGDPAAVQKAMFEIAGLVGEFEKPRYIKYDAEICAHGRSRKTGCTRCLDVCPVSAIAPNGDTVSIDPYICGGCGLCASVCPTGAAAYQFPETGGLLQRLRSLLGAYRAAGGPEAAGHPILLLHDPRHGAETISLMARGGRGLPARVLPFALNEVTQTGIDLLSSALAWGAAEIVLLTGPEKTEELEPLAQLIGLFETVMDGLGFGGGRLHLIEALDPDAVEAELYALSGESGKRPAAEGSFLPMGGKRTRSMLALRHLHEQAENAPEILPLPKGAPFGAIKVDTEGCTLCLACVSACPTGALVDREDRPWLGFQEEACVQCGLCRNTCPESVISLEPRLNFGESAKSAIMLNEQEPFNCIRCGKPFGVKTSIDRVVEQLGGKHWMFGNSEQTERIKMCDDCRVIVQFQTPNNPLQGAERPRTRTTEDYLREREEIEAARREHEDKKQ
ncbi:MAG: 4Fe-4S binding protein [Rhodovibrionaceae bacterium]